MGDYYERQEPLKVDPKRGTLFTLRSSAKKNWYVRILRRKGSGYYQKSLKTTSLDEAQRKASDIYMEMWTSETKGYEFTDRRFSPLFIEFLENSGLGRHRHIRAKGIFQRYFSPFFGNTPVTSIDSKMFHDYLRWRVTYWQRAEESGTKDEEVLSGKRLYHTAKVPSETTLKSERQILKQFLYYCNENRYLEHVPPLKAHFKNIRGLVKGVQYNDERQKAKALSKKMEGAIERSIRKYALTDGQKDNNPLRRFGKARLYYFTYICRHTLIRPSTEATALKWEDVEIAPSRNYPDHDLGLVHVRQGKGGKPRYCVMPYGQIHLLTQWRELTISLTDGRLGKPSDYIFPKWTGERAEATQIGRLLTSKLKLWGLHRTEEGKVITMYSIVRHTGITRRIERSKWDVGQVASAAGTSVFQISKFYYEAFVRQNPDRWALTWKGDKPILTDKKKEKLRNEVAKWEGMLEDFVE